MTLHLQREFSIPEETARVAHAVYPRGNIYMKMRDALGTRIPALTSPFCPTFVSACLKGKPSRYCWMP